LVGAEDREAAIDRKVAAIDPGGLFGASEDDDVRHFLHAADAAQRMRVRAGAIGAEALREVLAGAAAGRG